MDMLQNSTLNWSVVLSLLLTMYVSMAVMHTGSSAYASQVAPPPSGWLSPHMVMTRGVSWSWTWTWRLAGRARWCVTDEWCACGCVPVPDGTVVSGAGGGCGRGGPSGRVTLHVPPSVREPRRMRFVCDVMCAKAALPKPRSFTL